MERDSRKLIVMEGVLVFVLALGLRLLDLDRAFGGNELSHMLAGRSWIEDGTFRVAHGIYARNWEFTVLVSYLVQMFGETSFVARMPAVLAGSLSVAALFIWMRFAVGRSAAWFAALLFGVCPLAIEMSQWVRTYTLQGLFFFLGAVGIYSLLTREVSRLQGIVIGSVSVALLGVALHLHLISILGMAGLALWVLIERRQLVIGLANTAMRNRWGLVLLVFIVAGVLAALFLGNELDTLLRSFRDLQPQAAARESDYLFYHKWLIREYPLLWGAIPFVVAFAIARKPGFGMFCACIFFTTFLVYMFASRKWLRYLYYVMPFLAALWGFALAEVIPILRRVIAESADKLGITRDYPIFRNSMTGAIYGVSVVFLLSTNAVLIPVYYQLSSVGPVTANWAAAQPVLSPWLLDEEAVVLTSPMQHPLFYYGRADIEFGPKYIYESDTGSEFGIDRRTGLRTISSADSVALVFSCYQRGLFIMTRSKWRKEGFGPNDEVFEMLRSYASELTEVKQWGLVAFAWDRPPMRNLADCSVLKPTARNSQ